MKRECMCAYRTTFGNEFASNQTYKGNSLSQTLPARHFDPYLHH